MSVLGYTVMIDQTDLCFKFWFFRQNWFNGLVVVEQWIDKSEIRSSVLKIGLGGLGAMQWCSASISLNWPRKLAMIERRQPRQTTLTLIEC